MESALTCSLCLSTYDPDTRIPLFLPCGHTFCSECLSSLLQVPTPTCPQDSCQILINSLQDLPKNMSLLKLAKQNKSGSTICRIHNKKLDLLCLNDKQKICSHCALLGSHKDHQVREIQEVKKEILMRIDCLLDIFQIIEKTDLSLGVAQEVDKIAKLYMKKRILLQEKVRSEFQAVRSEINKMQKTALESLAFNFNYFEAQIVKAQEVPKLIRERAANWKLEAKKTLEQIDQRSSDPQFIALDLLSQEKLEMFHTGEQLLMDMDQIKDFDLSYLQDLIHSIQIEFDMTAVGKICDLPSLVVHTRFNQKAFNEQLEKLAGHSSNCADFSGVGNVENHVNLIVIALKKHPQLKTLRLNRNNLGDLEAAEILQALYHMNSLKELDLSFNPIGPKALKEIKELLKVNNHISKLKLKGNPLISEESRKELLDSFGNSKKIFFS